MEISNFSQTTANYKVDGVGIEMCLLKRYTFF